MIIAFFKKYLSIFFILATFMGVFHHHDDLKQHNDCQICTIQSNISNADTPTQTVYLTQIEQLSESVLTKLESFENSKIISTLKARAPPTIS